MSWFTLEYCCFVKGAKYCFVEQRYVTLIGSFVTSGIGCVALCMMHIIAVCVVSMPLLCYSRAAVAVSHTFASLHSSVVLLVYLSPRLIMFEVVTHMMFYGKKLSHRTSQFCIGKTT